MKTVKIPKMKSKVVFYFILCQVFGLSPEDEVKLNIEELRYKFNMLECLMIISDFQIQSITIDKSNKLLY